MTDETNNSNKSSTVNRNNVRWFSNFVRREVDYYTRVINSYSGILANRALTMMRVSMVTKVVVIFLGAVATTSGTLSVLYGEDNPAIVWFFTLVGLTIASVSGLDAAFKFEARASGRLSLAGDVTSSLFRYATEINTLIRKIEFLATKDIIEESDFNLLRDEYKVIQDNQVEYLRSVNQRSAELGVNLKWEQEQAIRTKEEIRETQKGPEEQMEKLN